MFLNVLRAILILSSLGLSELVASAEDEPAKLNGWQRLFRRHAAAYEVADQKAASPVKLIGDPILNWSQPARGGGDGAVFLWVQDGRPAFIGTLFIWPAGEGRQAVTHELHSLSRLARTITWKNRDWTPPKDSLDWKVIPNAPEPAATAELRLRQLRELSRQFVAESRNKEDRTWTLRLLPRPLYRYELDDKSPKPSETPVIMDGAMFGFVEGTDLEILLLLEAQQTLEGRQWKYALARMSDLQLKVKLNDKPAWEVDYATFGNSSRPYYAWTLGTLASPDDEAGLEQFK